MTATLQVTGLAKSYGELSVLRGLDLTVQPGELVTVLGASGGGKSTLLRLIAGFERPDAGEIRIADELLTGPGVMVAPEHRGVGIVPQDAALFPHLRVAENVGFGLERMAGPARRQRVAELLELVGLTEAAKQAPHELSGGQQQRVALARALAVRPRLVLLDEPFAALDAQLRAHLRDEVKRVLRDVGATALLVTHDQDEALSIADRVAILRDGAIAQIGAPREIYNHPGDVDLAGFLGESVVLPGVARGDKVETALGLLALDGEFADGTAGEVAIRPEAFYLQPDLAGAGTVIGRQYFGHDALVSVRTQGLVVQARTSGPMAPELGMKVTVWVRGKVNFFPQAA